MDLAKECRSFLDKHPATVAVELLLTDPCGIARGKQIGREELPGLFDHGRYVAGSILGLDATGEDVEGTGLVWSVGDADRLCRPVPNTLVVAPWHLRPTAQVIGTMYELDGRPFAADPRHVLARVVERLASDGFTAVVAAELEFYLLARGPDGALAPAPGQRSGRNRPNVDVYGLGKIEDMEPVFAEIFATAESQGVPARTVMSEYAPGQFEITLLHRSDAMRAIDEAILFKRLVRGVAARHGLVACFMAKPFEQHAGSGLHLHASLADAAGRNVFADPAPEGSELLRHAVGGLRSTLAESMLVFAPNANSYRRFRRQSYAPVTPCWGVNNRSVSLRIPAGPPSSRHVEHRVSGADANPYLVAAVVLAGMHAGIQARMEPGPPVTGNAYLQPVDEALPLDWAAAIQRAADSEFLHETFGAEFLRVLLAIKRQEYERFNARVGEVDYEWYLDTV
ncbi:MAG TPA: glutamine synthetase family protein [Steroidobacteraceae bacterium]|nr:glutamine synthetase family protein [Steroidobacteraceae bacterium]